MTQAEHQGIMSLYGFMDAEGGRAGWPIGIVLRLRPAAIELKALGCYRLCYHRHYHSMRWFGGLRELILTRDRFRCRGCGVSRRLIVHHRDGRNEESVLITLCIRCHVRLHRTRSLRGWIPEALLERWSELHPDAPLQFQLSLGNPAAAAADDPGSTEPHWRLKQGYTSLPQLSFPIEG